MAKVWLFVSGILNTAFQKRHAGGYRWFLVSLAWCFSLVSFSQSVPGWTSSQMYLSLRKLNVLGSVLYVAAHPDDENTRLITYFSKERLFRTGYLSLTRGDGGQNLIGNEQGIELGLIRTQELLAARRIDGGEQFFSRAFDFGYSKTPEETFNKWNKEKILSDVVWVIRKFQPDIIITRFPTTGEGGHGHHTGSAILANEAFAAAADPKRFPEQLKFVQTWQAKRVVWNTFNFGNQNVSREGQFAIDVGGYNPLLGRSNGEIAAESRSQHKSQGFGVPASRGEAMEYFKTTGGTPPVEDIMDGVELSWKRIPGGENISAKISELIASFDLMHPEKSVEGLVSLYKSIKALPDGHWKDQKLKEVQQLIEQCSGLFLDATTQEQFAVQTDSIRMFFSLNNRLGVDAELQRIVVDAFDTSLLRPLVKNKNFALTKTIYVSPAKQITQPYWLTEKMTEGYFNVNNPLQIGQPDIDAPYRVAMEIKIQGELFSFERPVKYKFTDPVKGELYQPLFVIPPATVLTTPSTLLFQKGMLQQKMADLQLNVNKAIKEPVAIEMRSQKDKKEIVDANGFSKFSNRVFEFKFTNEGNRLGELEKYYSLAHYNSKSDTIDIHKAIRAIDYDHIPSIKYFFTDYLKVLNIPLKTQGKKIGYIVGAGDKVPEALEQMGYDVFLLSDKELARNNLSQFDAIISGVRAYNTNEWMNKYYDKLMKYVSDGGNLIVQYNTSNQIGPIRAKIGPYPFNISRTRITDETSPVSFLKPQHPVLNFPNKITSDDFKGWVQERSIYHAADWDSTKFETILSFNDPGEKSEDGSLIIAKHGKGYFTYTGLVFFRELPAAVPGAYRLLANIIALNHKKGF